MTRNQQRIEGSYTIVSTNRPEFGDTRIMDAVRFAWTKGLSVALVVGVWDGAQEQSLILTGASHSTVGREIARTYGQDAYITVDGGMATLYVHNGYDYVVGNTFTRQIERTDKPNYTYTPNGRSWVFAA